MPRGRVMRWIFKVHFVLAWLLFSFWVESLAAEVLGSTVFGRRPYGSPPHQGSTLYQGTKKLFNSLLRLSRILERYFRHCLHLNDFVPQSFHMLLSHLSPWFYREGFRRPDIVGEKTRLSSPDHPATGMRKSSFLDSDFDFSFSEQWLILCSAEQGCRVPYYQTFLRYTTRFYLLRTYMVHFPRLLDYCI